MRVYQGIILSLEENKGKDASIIEQGLYKIYLLPPHSKIVNGIPLSYFGTHSTNYYRYSGPIYRPGDKVYLLQLEDKESKYYLILGSPGNIYVPEYQSNRVTIYDSLTGNGLIITEPELPSMNFTSGLYIKTDTIHKITSDVYLTTKPRLKNYEIKNKDIIEGNIPVISAYTKMEDAKILEAYRKLIEEGNINEVSYEARAPEDLIKGIILDSELFLRPESRKLKFPYNRYRIGKDLNIDNEIHLLHIYDMPHYNLSLESYNNNGSKINHYQLYSSDETNDKTAIVDLHAISTKYKDALKVLREQNITSLRDSVNFVDIIRKINFKDNLYIDNEPFINKTNILIIKKDSIVDDTLIRYDKKDEAKEIKENLEISNNSFKYIKRFSKLKIQNNKITKDVTSTTQYQSENEIGLRYDKYKKISQINLKEDEILLILDDNINEQIKAGLKIFKDFITLFYKNNAINVDKDNITITLRDGDVNTSIVITRDGVAVNVNSKRVLSIKSNGVLVEGEMHVSNKLSSPTLSGHLKGSISPVFNPAIVMPADNTTTNHQQTAQPNNSITQPTKNEQKNHQIQQPNIQEKKKEVIEDSIKDMINKIMSRLKSLEALAYLPLICLLIKVLSIIPAFIVCVLTNLDKILGLLMQILKELIKKVFEFLKEIINMIIQIIIEYIKMIIEFLKALVQMILDIFRALIALVKELLNLLKEFLSHLLGLIAGCLMPAKFACPFSSSIDDPNNLIEKPNLPSPDKPPQQVQPITDPIIDNIHDIVNNSEDNLNNITQELENRIEHNLQEMISLSKTNIEQNNQDIINIKQNIQDTLNDYIDTISAELQKTYDTIYNNLLNHIQNKDPNLYNEIVNLDQNLVQTTINNMDNIYNTLLDLNKDAINDLLNYQKPSC